MDSFDNLVIDIGSDSAMPEFPFVRPETCSYCIGPCDCPETKALWFTLSPLNCELPLISPSEKLFISEKSRFQPDRKPKLNSYINISAGKRYRDVCEVFCPEAIESDEERRERMVETQTRKRKCDASRDFTTHNKK